MNSVPVDSPPELKTAQDKPSLVRGLSLLDSVLLLVSGIIGSSIFLTAKDIAVPLPNPKLFFLVWVLGGLISLCACVAFAELGSMFPDSGGQYIYLREAYGDIVAFLYGWMLFAVANGGTIAALSVASAAYMGNIIPAISQTHVIFSSFRHYLHSSPSCRPDPHRDSDLGKRLRIALGHASAERLHLDEILRHGGICCARFRHRQRPLVELQRASARRNLPWGSPLGN